MTWYLLDTDAVIDYFKGFVPTVELITTLYRDGDMFCTCDVVIAEVYAGLDPLDRARGEELLASFQFLPTSSDAAAQAGLWRYAHARRGRQLPTTDCLIAAVALEHRALLVTGNTAHYPMPELAVHPLPR